MYSIAPPTAGAADQAWAKVRAAGELRQAADALDDARASLVGLSADTEWQSDGVRALHETLDDVAARTRAGAASVEARASELASIVIA